jgi:hypothetical protein
MAEDKIQLRNHPLVKTYCGRSNWPPVWISVDRKPITEIVGEIGTLRLAHYRIGYPTRCHLVIEHQNETFVGTLLFDDGAFCWTLTKFLRNHIGLSIEEIGALDLSVTT